MEIKIMKADTLGDDIRPQISEVFVGGFYQWLKYFSKDEEKLARAFAHMFKLELFYIAIVDGKVAGITAYTDGEEPCVNICAKEMRKHLGFIMGSFAAVVLKSQFEGHKYPFPVDKGTGSIEFVATSRAHRGKGIATAIIQHIIEATSDNEYILEVADTNTNAVKLYEKLGFREFTRVRMKNPKQSGVNFLVYMRYVRNGEK